MEKWIKKVVGNYMVPERPAFVPSVATIYETEDLVTHCTGLTPSSDVCVIGLYDGSQATAKVS